MDYNNKGRKVRPERQYNAELDENVVFGRNAVRELLSGGRDIEKIFVLSGEREGSITMLVGEARGRNIPIINVKAPMAGILPPTRASTIPMRTFWSR